MANSVETEIALVKNELSQMANLFLKLETALDKISEVSNNIGQMLAVHDQRINSAEDYADELKESIEMHRKEHQADIKELHSRLTSATRDLKNEMSQDVNKVLEEITALRKDLVERMNQQDERITSLEKWRWLLVGGIVLAGAFVPFLVDLFQIAS